MTTGDLQKPMIRFVTVFNHRFEANVEKLETIYGGRFSDIAHLMPFYTGTKPNVLRVYASSYTFQAFFAQAFEALYDPSFTHYVFAGDDLILHPRLNERNLLEELGVGPGAAYIKTLTPLSSRSFAWPHLIPTLQNWEFNARMWYVDFRRELPPAGEAASRLARHGLSVGDLTWANMRDETGGFHYGRRHMLTAASRLAAGRGRWPVPYPLLESYSDFFIVPAEAFREFCHLCGVFAAAGVFVEVAIPTALALSCGRIVREAETRWRGVEVWADAKVAIQEKLRGMELRDVIASFSDNQLYLHPVKLSGLRSVEL